MRRLMVGLSLVASAWLVLGASDAQAQILIWSLPKNDGAWVRFEGTYKQTQARPESNAGDETLAWRTELTISSVGRTKAAAGGADVDCRWVEFKTVTKVDDLEKQPGPGGTIVYKVLIPENRVTGKTVDDDGIPVTFIPIVKGYRKVGSREVEPVSERVLAVYPTIAPVTYYPNLALDQAASADARFVLANEPLAVRVFRGSRVLQSNLTRSTNAAVLTLCDGIPFGTAKFQVNLTREEKGLTATADEFRRKSLVDIELSVVKTGVEARSELPDSN